MTEALKQSAITTPNAVPASGAAGVRPPVLTPRRGGSLTFNLGGIVREYYGMMRFLGYVAGTIVDIYNDNAKKNNRDGADKDRISRIEAGVFAFLTLIYAWRDWKDMVNYFRGAVAAENGKPPGRIGGDEMRRSNNPIIQTAMRRFTMMNVARLGTDAMFLKNLYWGLLGMAGRITVERTLFSQKTAYDRLEKLFDDTQIYNFDVHIKKKIAGEYGNIVQQSQKDHRRPPWDRETLIHYMPLFETLAEGTVEKKISMSDATYVLGQLMTKRLTLEDSLEMVEKIRANGIDSLRLEEKRREKPGVEKKKEAPLAEETPVPAQDYQSRFQPMSRDQLQSLALGGPRSFEEMAAERGAEARPTIH